MIAELQDATNGGKCAPVVKCLNWGNGDSARVLSASFGHLLSFSKAIVTRNCH